MIFWIFVFLMVLGIVSIIVIEAICEEEIFICSSVIISVICGAIAVIMLFAIIFTHVFAESNRAEYEQKYNALMYKAQTESIRDEFGIINKEYIDEIQEWNEEIAEYQSLSDNFWVGIFYPKTVYEGLEIINLEDIKVKD